MCTCAIEVAVASYTSIKRQNYAYAVKAPYYFEDVHSYMQIAQLHVNKSNVLHDRYLLVKRYKNHVVNFF